MTPTEYLKLIAARAQAQSDREAKLEAALEMALCYLDHPEVRAIPFARPTECVADYIRRIVKKQAYMLVRDGNPTYSDHKPYIQGALDYRLYEWSDDACEYVQIGGVQ